ncbi:aminopeptidase P family N-terminal domain-containing protein, partial [Streptomyces sp. 2MCAF27]
MTLEDYTARMSRAARTAADAGLAGLVVTPGPDMVHLCGYRPPAETERLTALMVVPGQTPRLLVPLLERPDALAATGVGATEVTGWTDGGDPYRTAADVLPPRGRYGISDETWAVHLLGLQRVLPDTSYSAIGEALPMLRAVKDTHEVQRLASAGAAADAAYEEIVQVRFAGRRERDIAAD